jgi:hypothetical protein
MLALLLVANELPRKVAQIARIVLCNQLCLILLKGRYAVVASWCLLREKDPNCATNVFIC